MTEAVQSSKTLMIHNEIQAITHHYNMVAVGPAASEVREKGSTHGTKPTRKDSEDDPWLLTRCESNWKWL